jgi:DtxR family Mn-dependent transcriptional regulator
LIDILKVDSVVADEEACKMEHGMSSKTLDRLTQFIDFIQTCPRTGPDWLKSFDAYLAGEARDENCLDRLKTYAKDLKLQIKRLEAEEKQ